MDRARTRLAPWTRAPRRAAVALAASLALHLGGLAAAGAAGLLSLLPRGAIPISFVPLAEAEWQVNRLAAGAGVAERDRIYRFVEVPPDVEHDPLRAEAAPPESARHLAERAQRVEDERVSRDADRAERLLRVPQVAFEGSEGSGERGDDRFSEKGRTGSRGAGSPASRRRATAAAPAEGALPSAPVTDSDEPPQGPAEEALIPLPGAEDGRRIAGELVPGMSTRELPRPEGGPNMDGHREAAEGDETRLDAFQVDSAAFWVEIRRRIEGEWQKRAVRRFSREDPREELYFFKQRTAVLKVALGAAGDLRHVEVVESSKLGFFDDVALEAIRASTYPPPPAEALADNGEASIQVRVTWLPSIRGRGLR